MLFRFRRLYQDIKKGFSWVPSVLKVFCLGHLYADFVGSYNLTDGPSMLPTLAAEGDHVWVSTRYRHGRGIQVGDIISFKHPLAVGANGMKRVVGMPGDFVMRDAHEGWSQVMLQVPEGHCWVLGDNLTESRDSRVYGPIPLALVRGKATLKNYFGFGSGYAVFENTLKRPATTHRQTDGR